jgi:hypothetical protein
MKDKFKEEIILEVTKDYPNWSNIIEIAKQAREFEYPDDESGLYELSGLKEAFDVEKVVTKKEVVKDENFWK